jgi:hypothetical protein
MLIAKTIDTGRDLRFLGIAVLKEWKYMAASIEPIEPFNKNK